MQPIMGLINSPKAFYDRYNVFASFFFYIFN